MTIKRISALSLTAGVYSLLFAAGGCVPGNYASLPPPAGSVIKKQSAAGSGSDENPQQSSTSSGANSSNSTAPGTSTGTGTGTGSSPSNGGLVWGPGVPERDALQKCMNLWGTTPFKEVKANQVKVMDIGVSVGGGLAGIGGGLGGLGGIVPDLTFGNTKDLDSTTDPRLVVIPFSISLGGNTTYELMNPNGWYCLKFAVGAKSSVNIKLHCNAKIAQSDLGLSVNTKPSTTPVPGAPSLPISVGINNGSTSGTQAGIMVDSNVTLTRVNSSGGACP